MTVDELERARRTAMEYRGGDMPSLSNLARAYLHLHQSSALPAGEEAQPGLAPTPSAPAAAEFWPCVPVENFDANDPEANLTEIDR